MGPVDDAGARIRLWARGPSAGPNPAPFWAGLPPSDWVSGQGDASLLSSRTPDLGLKHEFPVLPGGGRCLTERSLLPRRACVERQAVR